MIAATQFKGLKVALFGLGGSGLAAAKSLLAGGADLLVSDDNTDACQKAVDAGFPVADFHDIDWSALDFIVASPGLPLTHPEPHWTVKKANAANIPIIGDLEIFERERSAQAPSSRLVAITGTNGKSTTTALIAHLLRELGAKVEIGGNIGRPALEMEKLENDCTYVIEYSSYQIELTPSVDPDVAILLNLSPDHLDRHGTMERYARIKGDLLRAALPDHMAIIGTDDEWCLEIAGGLKETKGHLEHIGVGHDVASGAYAINSEILLSPADGNQSNISLAGIESLRGEHNWENAAAALLALKGLGYPWAKVADALKTFPGLAHRMELVTEMDGIRFVNDSKATNADAAARSLTSYQNIFWVAGGRGKSGGIEPLTPFFDRIQHAFLIGEAAETFGKTLSGKVSFTLSGDLQQATKDAAEAAKEFARQNPDTRPVVLLAPAAASFDQFANFEVRGDAFKSSVFEITGDPHR